MRLNYRQMRSLILCQMIFKALKTLWQWASWLHTCLRWTIYARKMR